MKSPPVQFHDDEAYWMVEDFAGNAEVPGGAAATDRLVPRPGRSSRHQVSRRHRISSSSGPLRQDGSATGTRGPCDLATGGSEMLHYCHTVELGADGIEFLALAQLR